MGRPVIIAPSAESDLRNIVAYIAQHNQDAAIRLGHALINRTEVLAEFPELGRVVPEFNDPRLRELIYRSYRILYRFQPGKELVEVVRFWHAARGFPHVPPDR